MLVSRWLVYTVYRFANASEIAFHQVGYNWVTADATISFKSGVSTLLIAASAPEETTLEISGDDQHYGTYTLTNQTQFITVSLQQRPFEQPLVHLTARCGGRAPNGNVWRLEGLFTDLEHSYNILAEGAPNAVSSQAVSARYRMRAVRGIGEYQRTYLLGDPHTLNYRWDAGWYVGIAETGYSYNGNPRIQQNVAWPPLFPLTMRYLARLLHWRVADAGSMLNLLLACANAVLLTTLGLVIYGRSRLTYLPALLYAFYPFAVFNATLHSEALFVTFLLLMLIALHFERYWLAAGAGAAMSATRIFGLAATPIVFVYYLYRKGFLRTRGFDLPMLLKAGGLALIAASGQILYAVFLWVRFGDPFAYLRIQQAWGMIGEGASLTKLVRNLLLYPAERIGSAGTDPYVVGVGLLYLFVLLAGYVLFVRRHDLRPVEWAIAAHILILAFMASVGLRLAPDAGLGRYTLSAAPGLLLFIRVDRGPNGSEESQVLLAGVGILLIVFAVFFVIITARVGGGYTPF